MRTGNNKAVHLANEGKDLNNPATLLNKQISVNNPATLLNKQISVKLKNGEIIKGKLEGYDSHNNLLLSSKSIFTICRGDFVCKVSQENLRRAE